MHACRALRSRQANHTPLPTPCSAEPTAALLRTCLLEASRFDQALVHWLLNRGTDVAAPLQCHSSNTTPPDSCAPLPATAIVLRKLRRELHVQHMLGDLGVAGCSTQHASLLQQAAGTLTALLAAGAPPVGAPDPSGAMAAAAAAMQPADWAAVQQAASEPPRWSVQRHGLFPRAFRRTAREVLLVARRGFAVQCGDGGADPAAQGHQQSWTTFYLDPGIVLCIVKHLTPCCQL